MSSYRPAMIRPTPDCGDPCAIRSLPGFCAGSYAGQDSALDAGALPDVGSAADGAVAVGPVAVGPAEADSVFVGTADALVGMLGGGVLGGV